MSLGDSTRVFFLAREEWSQRTFGPTPERGPLGPLRHLRKELLEEVLPELEDEEGNPRERTLSRAEFLEELVDVQFLLHDAVSRDGFSYEEFLDACWAKLRKNQGRRWGPTSADGITEHVRE